MNDIEKSLFDVTALQAVANHILAEAKRCQADHAEACIAMSKGYSVSAREGAVETVEYNQDKVIEIKVYVGQRSGMASISDIRPEAVRAAVEAACHIAKFTDVDPAAGLAAKEELAFNYPHLDLAFPWSISVADAIELACQCEREALHYDKRIMSAEEVSIATGDAMTMYVNSNDFVGYFPHTRHEISCVLVAKDGDDMQRDYGYTVATRPEDLASISVVAKEAAERTLHRLGARRLSTMKVPVIFAAEEARSLLQHFASAISGGNIYRKASFLVDKLEQKIFPSFVQLDEQPHLPLGLGSVPFDGDGVATRHNVFVEAGVLRQYALGVYSARKLGMKTTGNAGGVHNLSIKLGDKNLSALLKTMHRGLLITELMGHGVNLLTGDYSRGVGGFWVDNGEIQYPVHEITIASKLQDMFARMLEVGNDIDVRGSVRTGSILIEEMMIAGS